MSETMQYTEAEKAVLEASLDRLARMEDLQKESRQIKRMLKARELSTDEATRRTREVSRKMKALEAEQRNALLPKTRSCDWCAGEGFFPNKKTRIGSAVTEQQDCSHCEGRGEFPEFTEEDKKNFINACRATWESIGADVEAGGGRISNRAICEVVLDADYMDHYGGRSWDPDPEKRRKFILRMKQIRYSGVAKKWAKEAMRGF
jgi:hypothetical protein